MHLYTGMNTKRSVRSTLSRSGGMGLRDKVALAVVVTITTQIICNHCFPEGLSNGLTNSLKPNKVNDFNTNQTMQKNLLVDMAADEDFKGILYPDVKYPLDSQRGHYYRLHNTQQNNFKSKLRNNLSKISPRISNIKREPAHKCKYDHIGNAIADAVTQADPDYEPALQSHRFTDSSFFPEVEYPLSARDTWGPKYWNQLHDEMEKEPTVPKSRNPLTDTTYSNFKYEKFTIKGVMKTSNTKNKLTTKTMNKNSEISIYNNNNDFRVPNNSFIAFSKTLPYDNIVPMVTDVPVEKITSATISDLWYSGVTFATTASPFDYMTSPITPLQLPTIGAPSNLSAENLENYTLPVESTTIPKIKSTGDFDGLIENWVLSTNDSIITWKSFPEDCDDWELIFVDTPKTSPSINNYCDINSNVPDKEEIPLIPNNQFSNFPIPVQSNSVNDVNIVASEEQFKLGELFKQKNKVSGTEVKDAGSDLIMPLEGTKSNLHCEYNDDTWVSYTEAPDYE